MTGAGIILGTAAYMSPEQARGKTVDKRADIWAFGCVLFEMLTAQRVFIGETTSDTLASVLKTDPNWRALPGAVPAGLRRLLRRCLEKDPKRRLQAIGEARVQIEDLVAGSSDDTDASAMAAASARWRALPWVLTALAVGGLAVALILGRAPPAPAGRLARFVITTPSGAPFRSVCSTGRNHLAGWIARRVSERPRCRRQFDGASVHPRPRSVRCGAASRDRWCHRPGVLPRRHVDRVPGRARQCAQADLGARRVPGEYLLAGRRSAAGRELGPRRHDRVRHGPEQGTAAGTRSRRHARARDDSRSRRGESGHFWPQVLPDGRAVLFTSWGGSLERARVAMVSLPSGEVHSLLDGTSARFSPTGHLIFAAADRTLRAVGFDARRLQVTGNPVTVVDPIGIERTGGADFAVADDGSLVYATSATWSRHCGRWSGWIEQGTKSPSMFRPGATPTPACRRTGRESRSTHGTSGTRIWIWDLAHHILQRLTNDPGPNRGPIWTPDGKRVAFTAERDGVESVYWQAFDGSGTHGALEQRHAGPSPEFVLAGWHAVDLRHTHVPALRSGLHDPGGEPHGDDAAALDGE